MDLEKSILFQIAGNLEIFIITSLYILWFGINSVYEALLKIRLDQANNMAAMGEYLFLIARNKKKILETISYQTSHKCSSRGPEVFLSCWRDKKSKMPALASDWPEMLKKFCYFYERFNIQHVHPGLWLA